MELRDILSVAFLKEQEDEEKSDKFPKSGENDDYKKLFYKLLDKYKEKFNVDGIEDMTDEQKKEFYNEVDKKWKSDEEKENDDDDKDDDDD